MSLDDDATQWRWVFGCAGLFALAVIVGVVFEIRRTPRQPVPQADAADFAESSAFGTSSATTESSSPAIPRTAATATSSNASQTTAVDTTTPAKATQTPQDRSSRVSEQERARMLRELEVWKTKIDELEAMAAEYERKNSDLLTSIDAQDMNIADLRVKLKIFDEMLSSGKLDDDGRAAVTRSRNAGLKLASDMEREVLQWREQAAEMQRAIDDARASVGEMRAKAAHVEERLRP